MGGKPTSSQKHHPKRTSEAWRVAESASQSSWTTSCFALSSKILLLVLGFSIFSPFLSCWNGVNAQQKSKDMKPADLEVVLLAMEAAGDVGDFKAFKDSTVRKKEKTCHKS